MQLGPSLSPDGTQAVFFSERDRLSLDLFLADVDTGRVIRKLATTAASARFDSLQPLRSAGAWSPDGRWFAFAAVRQGHAALLMLVDMRPGHRRSRDRVFERSARCCRRPGRPTDSRSRSRRWPAASPISTVTDLATGTLRQLTDDAFADLQPAWSHDGRSIAFVTERYSSDLSTLHFGRPQLAMMDVGDQRRRATSTFEHGDGRGRGTHLNPQWSADDRDLYFVGDADGTANVFRVDLESSAVRRVTNVSTGVSGITPTSPALSVSADGSTMAFTVYKNGRPRLVVLDRAKPR